MTNKKNSFLTFWISLIPGAGEMYLGFYKMGGSIMVLFWGTVALSGSLFPPLFYLLPVMWFYSFFHTHNLNRMPDDEFYALEDDWLFHVRPEEILHGDWVGRYRRQLAFLLVIFGISIIWNTFCDILFGILYRMPIPEIILDIIRTISRAVPQLAAALVIIWIGLGLFRNKKEELVPEPPYLEDKKAVSSEDDQKKE